MGKILEENVEKWFELSRSGQFQEAKDFYFDVLFENVIDIFVENTKAKKVDVLTRFYPGAYHFDTESSGCENSCNILYQE